MLDIVSAVTFLLHSAILITLLPALTLFYLLPSLLLPLLILLSHLATSH